MAVLELLAKQHFTTMFFQACIEGNADVIECILKSKNVDSILDLNVTDDHGDTGLILACSNGNENVVKLIIDSSENYKINVHAKNNDGHAGFYLAVKNQNENIMDIFISCGNQKLLGNIFLEACSNEDVEVIDFMLKRPDTRNKIDFNFTDSNGATGFILACARGNETLVTTFLEMGLLFCVPCAVS